VRPLVSNPAGDVDLRAFMAIFEQSLAGTALPADFFARFKSRNPRRTIWLARKGREVVGGYILLPLGQFFGDRSVAATGISAVAVAPEHRGAGVAIEMMRHAMRESARAKRPISILYPATQTLYRAAGFELAGSRILYAVPTRAADGTDRTLAVRRATLPDRVRLRELHREAASRTNGNLDRGDWSWTRVLDDPAVAIHAYLVGPPKREEGYVVFHQKPEPVIRYEVWIRDFAASTERAGRRIWALLADHRSMAPTVHLYGAPAEPLLHLLPEQDFKVETRWDWMLRIVDVRGAMESRGWPAGFTGRLEMEIEDPLVRANRGRFVVAIEGGRAKVSRGGRGSIRIHVRGLAPLFTGHLSPEDLVRTGQLEGGLGDLALARAAFAGPAPWMPDMF
jgi:predicted acetyltransferase